MNEKNQEEEIFYYLCGAILLRKNSARVWLKNGACLYGEIERLSKKSFVLKNNSAMTIIDFVDVKSIAEIKTSG